jgi:hypothetical protein
MLLSDYIAQVQFLVHDQTFSDFTQAELISAINNARKVVAEDFQCCRVAYLAPSQIGAPSSPFYQSVTVPPLQEIYPLVGQNGLNGQVVGATVTAGGTNYTAATTVTFAAGPTGSTRATAVPVIVAGVITGINMTAWGTGYTPALPGTASVPAVTIADSGGGSGATATATMFNNVFNVISISYLWGNQRYMLCWRGFTLFQAYMRSQTFFTQRGLITTIHQQAGFVLIQPPPDQSYVTEWDVICVDPLPLVLTTDLDTQVTAPWNDAVQYWASYLCLMKLQNFQQAEFMLKLYSARVPKIIIGAGGVRIPNPYNKSFQRRVSR